MLAEGSALIAVPGRHAIGNDTSVTGGLRTG